MVVLRGPSEDFGVACDLLLVLDCVCLRCVCLLAMLWWFSVPRCFLCFDYVLSMLVCGGLTLCDSGGWLWWF